MKSRKGRVFYVITLSILFLLCILPAAFYISYNKESKFSRFIGESQLLLLNTYDRGESIMFFIDRSAELSIREAISAFARYGGYDKENQAKEECGNVDGYNLWNRGDDTCFPVNVKESIIKKFTSELKEYFVSFSEKLPEIEYEIVEGDGKFTGKAKQSLRVDVGEDDIFNFMADSQDFIYEKVQEPIGSVPVPTTPPVTPTPTTPPVVTGTCSDLISYADEFVQKECPYRLWCHTYGPGCVSTTPQYCRQVGLTCATFVSSVTRKRGVSLGGDGIQKCTYNSGAVTMLGTNVNSLQPGDIFQAGRSSPGHTGIYAGKGFLGGTEKRYFGVRHCFTTFMPDPDGRHVFVHSIGNSDQGQPGVCYEYYEDLFAAGRYQVTQYCRLKVCG